jgi:site-specific recombinase XerD
LDNGSNPETRNPDPEVYPPAGASTIRPAGPSPFDQVTDLVVNSVHSEHSRRAYRRALEDFIAWYQAQPGRPPLSKALVHEYRVALTDAKLAPSTINVQLSAIRKLAAEAADNGALLATEQKPRLRNNLPHNQ